MENFTIPYITFYVSNDLRKNLSVFNKDFKISFIKLYKKYPNSRLFLRMEKNYPLKEFKTSYVNDFDLKNLPKILYKLYKNKLNQESLNFLQTFFDMNIFFPEKKKYLLFKLGGGDSFSRLYISENNDKVILIGKNKLDYFVKLNNKTFISVSSYISSDGNLKLQLNYADECNRYDDTKYCYSYLTLNSDPNEGPEFNLDDLQQEDYEFMELLFSKMNLKYNMNSQNEYQLYLENIRPFYESYINSNKFKNKQRKAFLSGLI
jgi:hypothetical protein